MPNWCYNEVKASEKVLNEIYNKVKKEATFKKLIPMPKSLLITEGTITNIAIKYALIKMDSKTRLETLEKLKEHNVDLYSEIEVYTNKDKEAKEQLQKLYKFNKEYKPDDEEKKLGIKHLKELGNTYISNIVNYGHTTWYGWCNANWGTKWDAKDTCGSPEEGILSFLTAWSPPEGVVQKLFEKFPNEEIDWYYEEPGMDFAGHFTPDYEGGVIDNPCPVPDYFNEEYEELEE